MKNKRIGNLFITMGVLLVAAALGLNLYNHAESDRAGKAAENTVLQLESRLPEPVPAVRQEEAPAELAEWEASTPDYLIDPEIEMPFSTVDGVNYIGVLSIPSLSIELPVIDRWDESLLKLAPCRYTGSAYLDDLVICAHNYRTHFGSLKNIHIGDSITFTDVDGNLFSYEVVDIETLSATSIEDMTTGDWALTLFTCTMGGKTRLAVRAE